MSVLRRLMLRSLACLLLFGGALHAAPLGTAFTYQGRVLVSGVAYTGTCDFSFSLWDAMGTGSPPTGGSLAAVPVGPTAIPVSSGLFTATLDFGANAFNSQARFLQIAVGCPSGSSAVALAPRQEVKPAPYALALPFVRSTSGAASPNIVGGSSSNSVDGASSGITVAGGGALGNANVGLGDYATVSGGSKNNAGFDWATIGGGYNNAAFGNAATIGGGASNTANPQWSTISGGSANTTGGVGATVPGGFQNAAGGDYSFAAGRRAKANGLGSFVWADANDFDFVDTVANGFKVRATGGVRFVVGIDGNGAMTWSCLLGDGSAWACSSDRDVKENFEPLDQEDVLARVSRLPVLKWNAKGTDPRVKHVGPMAQDFAAAFALGDDDKLISTIDLDGVELAAIQGLDLKEKRTTSKLTELEAKNAALEASVEELRMEKRRLEARLSALEHALGGAEGR